MATRVKQILTYSSGAITGDPYTAGDITTRVIIDSIWFTANPPEGGQFALRANTGSVGWRRVARFALVGNNNFKPGTQINLCGSDACTFGQFQDSNMWMPDAYTGTGSIAGGNASTSTMGNPRVWWQIPSSFYVNGPTSLDVVFEGNLVGPAAVSLTCIGEY